MRVAVQVSPVSPSREKVWPRPRWAITSGLPVGAGASALVFIRKTTAAAAVAPTATRPRIRNIRRKYLTLPSRTYEVRSGRKEGRGRRTLRLLNGALARYHLVVGGADGRLLPCTTP